ncbi:MULTISPECIES: helix-turn-helix domain-containing protein [unclassified Streptococcus]|uniref:helix-turn-helix domain-containing protein n=1 Tax=unclassified Streptococcus TaxID=2608887 RepID=UPI00359DA560
MRHDFGYIYKKIRKSKGLTQVQVCGDMISRTTLTKIESGIVVPKFENMIFLLDQINMSLEEFRYICNHYRPRQREHIFERVYNYKSIADNTELYQIKCLCEEHLKTHHDIPIKKLLDKINVTLLVRKQGFLNPSEELQQLTKRIWDELAKQDTWYERDLKMIGVILFTFPLETIIVTTDKLLVSLEKYKDYRNINDLKYALLANLSSIFLYNNLIKDCERLTMMIEDLARETKRYDQLGFAQVRLGICRDDRDLIDKGLALLDLTGEEQMLSNFREELDKLKK